MQPLPGFRDFYPSDCTFRNFIFSRWREICRRFNFVEYDGPLLETIELYQKKSGDEILSQIYHFIDKGNRHVALRPEMTPTLARMVEAHFKEYKKPIKWFSIPQLFRYERAQKGRLREHYQLNCDIVGEADLEADIELINLAIDILLSFDLGKDDFVVRVSDRLFWTEFLKKKAIPRDDWYAFFQAIDKIEREPRVEIERRLGDLAKEVFAILESPPCWERFEILLEGLRHRGLADYVCIDLGIVRGLAYYTGIVYEIFDRAGEFRAIAGGGRYDDLLRQIGGEDIPATGFGMGDVVLGEIIRKKNVIQPSFPRLDVYVVFPEGKKNPQGLFLIEQLRRQGFSVDFSFCPSKLKKQLATAQSLNARFALIVSDKIEEGIVEIKNMDERTQLTLPVEQLAGWLKERS
ncbi:histidine--tRNA ligase [Candidatus Methylacidiphilum infernorum]|uniref:Histidine--tRNA ligase n=1 Tax=Candidatus Methylacidiphilum infernorum TaxID=511746 RepID=A0ABX7PTV0_9BACT|nr:histidine--tRNA ligase [Candidatus Methylacidiphilum infernorum]QSR86036.1 histidine--tRNA ligase [Candidatus Methylacidiphilum infernorum]